MSPREFNSDEFNRLGDEVYMSGESAPIPKGNLAVSVALEDGVPFFLQAGDVVSGLQDNNGFKGYFDGVVKYDPDRGWALQVRTGHTDSIDIYMENVKQFKIYD